MTASPSEVRLLALLAADRSDEGLAPGMESALATPACQAAAQALWTLFRETYGDDRDWEDLGTVVQREYLVRAWFVLDAVEAVTR